MEGRSAKAFELMLRTVWAGFFAEEDPLLAVLSCETKEISGLEPPRIQDLGGKDPTRG